MDYTFWSIRKPPANVRVMIICEGNVKLIGYRDTFDMLRVASNNQPYSGNPLKWKKIEKDEWGDYIW